MKDIDLSLISKYRGELMGFAMIYVVMFHVCGNRHDTLWYCLARCGNLGVDIFLFLSGGEVLNHRFYIAIDAIFVDVSDGCVGLDGGRRRDVGIGESLF